MNFGAMISGIGRLKEAMECGKEVADPALWKNRAMVTNKIAILLSFAVRVLFLVNNIITLITSKKVGI